MRVRVGLALLVLGLVSLLIMVSPGPSLWPGNGVLRDPVALQPQLLEPVPGLDANCGRCLSVRQHGCMACESPANQDGQSDGDQALIVEVRTARIEDSLFDALDAAGIPDAVLAQVVDLFTPEVDFNILKPGDRLTVQWLARVSPGSLRTQPVRLMAAQVRQGQLALEAIWVERADGQGDFHALDGRPRSRTFLMSPIAFDRVSSGFVDRREHPLYPGHWQAHRGIDIPAPIGTPVRATADGTVEGLGVNGGYGRMIRIRHNDRQVTLYAHLDEFAPGLAVGRRVNQSEVIGTVGRTGDATGPHLHFEFIQDGSTIDPAQALDDRPLQALGPSDRQALYAQAERMRSLFRAMDSVRAAPFE
ncbi:MAG: M23 family metallopeptidase [Burkholderiales bacterium]|jgi:murein DD-endopeptidase MepM/ murein hydrolase activator NlpD